MFQLKNVINGYGIQIKYALGVLFFIFMIIAIRTYVNYVNVLDSIAIVNNRTASVQNEMDYVQNFQIKYLQSEYGSLFLAHDNSMIFRGEEIILFKSSADTIETGFDADLTHIPYRPTEEEERKNMDPKAARNLYLQGIFEKI